MDDLYRDEILEHYREPHNFGTLDAPDAVHEGHNPLCGDRITMMLAVDEDGTVSDVAFSGRGCAISQASASLLTDEIRGRPLAEVEAMTNQDILDLLGIEISPARLKCALLSLDTMQHALADRADTGATSEAGADDQPIPTLRLPASIHHGVTSPMTKSYRDLLREAREQVREVTTAEAERAAGRGATLLDVREASEWEQGHVSGARHISKSYIEQEIESLAPDRATPLVVYCAGGIRSLFAGQTLQEMGYTDVRSMTRRLPGLEVGRPRLGAAAGPDARSRSHATRATCSSPRSGPRARLACSTRRCCSSVPAAWARRPCSTWPPPAWAPSASSTSTSSTPPTCSARSSTAPTAWACARWSRPR